MMSRWGSMACLALGLSMVSHPGGCANPTAMVEDVSATVAGLAPLDYLAPGQIIHLGVPDRLVIDYLHSCIRETIAAGTVTIGSDRSTIDGGRVSRETVACDGGQLQLSTDQSKKADVIVFRNPPSDAKLPKPARIVYGTNPIFDLPGVGILDIERLDKPGPPLTLTLGPDDLVHGHFYDCARSGQSLARGGLYRAAEGTRSIVFRISKSAEPGVVPPAGRLIRL